MMVASNILLLVAIVSALCGVTSAMMIAAALERRGIAVNWIWLRMLILSKYLGQYRDITSKETGRTGALFYIYIGAMNLALASAILGLLLR